MAIILKQYLLRTQNLNSLCLFYIEIITKYSIPRAEFLVSAVKILIFSRLICFCDYSHKSILQTGRVMFVAQIFLCYLAEEEKFNGGLKT